MANKDSVLTVLDKSPIIAPSLDKKQLNGIARVVDRYQNILGHKWSPDAKRVLKRTSYDLKESTFLTTFSILTPLIFVKWLTLWKRVGVGIGVGIPLGYTLGENQRKKGLVNLCDTSDNEVGKLIRDDIFAKGMETPASQYLIARGYGGYLYPASMGDINKVKVSDDYERSGKAYTKLVYLEGELNDIVYVLNHIKVQDMHCFALKDHHIGVEGSIVKHHNHYKATIKVHSVPKHKPINGQTKMNPDQQNIKESSHESNTISSTLTHESDNRNENVNSKLSNNKNKEGEYTINQEKNMVFNQQDSLNSIEKQSQTDISSSINKKKSVKNSLNSSSTISSLLDGDIGLSSTSSSSKISNEHSIQEQEKRLNNSELVDKTISDLFNRGVQEKEENDRINNTDMMITDIIRKEVLKSTVEEVKKEHIHHVKDHLRQVHTHIEHITTDNHSENTPNSDISKQTTINQPFNNIKTSIHEDQTNSINSRLYTNGIISRNSKSMNTATTPSTPSPTLEEDEDDYDYLYEDLLGSPVPPDFKIVVHDQEIDYFEPMLEDILGTPIPYTPSDIQSHRTPSEEADIHSTSEKNKEHNSSIQTKQQIPQQKSSTYNNPATRSGFNTVPETGFEHQNTRIYKE